MLCREEKQCALNDRIIKNGPRNENQRIATAFFSSLIMLRIRKGITDAQILSTMMVHHHMALDYLLVRISHDALPTESGIWHEAVRS
jgi:hypothetical protein